MLKKHKGEHFENKLLEKELYKLSQTTDEVLFKERKKWYIRSAVYSLSGIIILVVCILIFLFVRW